MCMSQEDVEHQMPRGIARARTQATEHLDTSRMQHVPGLVCPLQARDPVGDIKLSNPGRYLTVAISGLVVHAASLAVRVIGLVTPGGNRPASSGDAAGAGWPLLRNGSWAAGVTRAGGDQSRHLPSAGERGDRWAGSWSIGSICCPA